MRKFHTSHLLRFTPHKKHSYIGLRASLLKMAEVLFYIQLTWLKGTDTEQTDDCVLKSLEGWMALLMIEMYLKFLVELRSSRIIVKWSRFPYQKETINHWFEHTLLIEGEEQQRTISIMNVNKDGKRAKCYTLKDDKRFPESLGGNSFEVYFHGTEHAHAQKIIEKGIRLTEGKMCQDFSNGDGFYLFQTFGEALDWAGERHRNPAVLCFRVNKTELRGDNNDKGLDLLGKGNKQQWEEVVSKFWQGKKSIIKEIGHYHFIEGPQASWNSKNKRLRKPISLNETYQLCVRQNGCARLFDRSVCSVLFFE